MSEQRFLVAIVEVPERAAFSVRDAARYLGMSPNTLRRRADRGLIRVRRDERNHRVFLLRDLDDYLNALPVEEGRATSVCCRSVEAERGKGGSV